MGAKTSVPDVNKQAAKLYNIVYKKVGKEKLLIGIKPCADNGDSVKDVTYDAFVELVKEGAIVNAVYQNKQIVSPALAQAEIKIVYNDCLEILLGERAADKAERHLKKLGIAVTNNLERTMHPSKLFKPHQHIDPKNIRIGIVGTEYSGKTTELYRAVAWHAFQCRGTKKSPDYALITVKGEISRLELGRQISALYPTVAAVFIDDISKCTVDKNYFEMSKCQMDKIVATSFYEMGTMWLTPFIKHTGYITYDRYLELCGKNNVKMPVSYETNNGYAFLIQSKISTKAFFKRTVMHIADVFCKYFKDVHGAVYDMPICINAVCLYFAMLTVNGLKHTKSDKLAELRRTVMTETIYDIDIVIELAKLFVTDVTGKEPTKTAICNLTAKFAYKEVLRKIHQYCTANLVQHVYGVGARKQGIHTADFATLATFAVMNNALYYYMVNKCAEVLPALKGQELELLLMRNILWANVIQKLQEQGAKAPYALFTFKHSGDMSDIHDCVITLETGHKYIINLGKPWKKVGKPKGNMSEITVDVPNMQALCKLMLEIENKFPEED